jgi:SAM-dependent methyltransferase/uncharacterized protein YbaR (Trm112 family)
MTTKFDFIAHLRCPFCVAGLERANTLREASNGEVEYGILACTSCKVEFPVVAGIPILMAAHETIDSKFETTEITMLDGPRVADLLAMLKQGNTLQALASLLNPSKLGGDWFPSLDLAAVRDGAVGGSMIFEGDGGSGGPRLKRVARRAKRVARRTLGKFVLPRARVRLATFLGQHQPEMSALDVIDLYYRRYSGTETYNYFAFRFGQPRHLAALSLALPLLETDGPLLDLACGAGHVTHFLCASQPGRLVVGLDRDFFRLWLAKHYTAPSASYVCAPADRALPFANEAFTGIFCSDAFHCFLHRAATVRELQRLVTGEGVIVLARFGNANVEPREGYELAPHGYQRLFGDMPHVLLGEDELVAAYRRRSGPDLSARPISDEVERQKWLSIVASKRTGLFTAPKPLAHWPHAVGRLQLNPIYRIEKRAENGDVDLRFEFPSDWYKIENHGYLEYAPETCRVPGAVMRALETKQAHPELDTYVAQFVLIGMPDHYCVA